VTRKKDEIIELIRRLPDDVTTADVMQELYFERYSSATTGWSIN